jgi:hypothetical protein
MPQAAPLHALPALISPLVSERGIEPLTDWQIAVKLQTEIAGFHI